MSLVCGYGIRGKRNLLRTRSSNRHSNAPPFPWTGTCVCAEMNAPQACEVHHVHVS